MLDIKYFHNNFKDVRIKLERKGISANILLRLYYLYEDKLELTDKLNLAQSISNNISKEVGKLTNQQRDKVYTIFESIRRNIIENKIHEFKNNLEKLNNPNAINNIPDIDKNILSLKIKIRYLEKDLDLPYDDRILNEKLNDIELKIKDILSDIPNIPDESVPQGKSAEDNVQFRIWGEKAAGDFKFLDHVQLGKKLDILDFAVGTKISGSGFPFYKGKGAMLERALINFMLDSHKLNGYTEVGVPYLVNRESMEAAEKVPKFEEDMYRTEPDDLFAIPTAEVPIVNIHRDEMLELKALPKKYCGYTACFRREAGSYGKDTKGFLRVHQFNKVELINFCLAEDSYAQMEEMLNHACGILEALNIHYRVVNVCTGDMGFAASKQYDIEVWSPAENKWLEASSVSNCTDFQSRRAMIRVKRDKKTEFVHILNGSGLATSRLYVSLIESNQTPEGKIVVPKALHKYTGFEIIE